jgi:hypothetical protein
MQPIDLIRRDMPDAIRQLRAVHDWADRDITDLREAVRRAVIERDCLPQWAAWLGELAEYARQRTAQVRAMEVEMAAMARAANAQRQPWLRVA